MQIGGVGSVTMFGGAQFSGAVGGLYGGAQSGAIGDPVGGSGAVNAAEKADPGARPGYKSSPAECQTCRERKYIDGSDENVSFKSAAHISPNAAAAVVRGHEGEHVANAYSKAAQSGGTVVNASVSIHTAVCPECGRTYVSGGTTHTMIRYNNESNPYQKNRKAGDAAKLVGGKINIGV